MNHDGRPISRSFLGLLLVVAIAGAFGFVFRAPLGSLGEFIDRQFAAIGGISASVEPNPVNLLAQQLEERDKTLDVREMEIAAREAALAQMLRREIASRYMGIIALLVVSVLLLLGLIGLNFYLDAKRTKEREGRETREGELLTRL